MLPASLGRTPGVVQGCREELLGRDRQPAQALVLHTALPAQSPSRTLLPFSLSAPGVPGTVQRVVPGLALSPWTQKPMTELSEQAQGTKSGAWGQNGARRSQSLKHSCTKKASGFAQHVPVQMPRGKLRRLCICGPEQNVGESLKAPCIPMSDIP